MNDSRISSSMRRGRRRSRLFGAVINAGLSGREIRVLQTVECNEIGRRNQPEHHAVSGCRVTTYQTPPATLHEGAAQVVGTVGSAARLEPGSADGGRAPEVRVVDVECAHDD